MKIDRLYLLVFVLFSSLFSTAYTMQENAVAEMALVVFLIIIALLILLIFFMGGFVYSDDLTVIEGIGPEISKTLNAAGIKTYAKLAGTDKTTLDKFILDHPKFNLARPDTWARQAKLARDGKWDELKKLKEDLKAGLKV
ncbi:MAG: hypothetical protein HGA23_04965 [Bacteroidales bacterium]|nr:hypothetical protein [Bacteroidales bacterium]